MTLLRRHANGVNAFAVHVGEKWHITVDSGEFHVLCDTLEQAKAAADELVETTFPHDCDECPSWEHPEPGDR